VGLRSRRSCDRDELRHPRRCRVLQSGPLRSEGRQDTIIELVLSGGSIHVYDIVRQFDVSRMTIRRDLNASGARGTLRALRGFVTAVASSFFEATTDYRNRQPIEGRRSVARVAFELVEPGQVGRSPGDLGMLRRAGARGEGGAAENYAVGRVSSEIQPEDR